MKEKIEIPVYKKQNSKSNNTSKFKQKYFDYYDDVKHHSHKIIDW